MAGERRAAARRGGRLRAPERELRGLDRPAERARAHLADRDPELADRRADRTGIRAPLLGQVALRRAVLEARHLRVVLREVGRGVAEIEDVAAVAEQDRKSVV